MNPVRWCCLVKIRFRLKNPSTSNLNSDKLDNSEINLA